jgi:hypothetical protein
VVIDGMQARLGCGFLVIPGRDTLYVAPNLVIHYIVCHGYRPPPDFVDAVLACPPLSSAAYLRALRRLGPPSLRWCDSFDDYAPARWRLRVSSWLWGEADEGPRGARAVLWRAIRRF